MKMGVVFSYISKNLVVPFEDSQGPSIHPVHAIEHSQPALKSSLHQWGQSPRCVAIVLSSALLQQLPRCHVLQYQHLMMLNRNIIGRGLATGPPIPLHTPLACSNIIIERGCARLMMAKRA